MSLKGNWIAMERKDWSGKDFVICEIEYNGSPWGSLSTFDSALIAEAEKLKAGDEVTFETKKSGKYTNLIMLNDVKASGKEGQKTSGGGQTSFPKQGGGYKKDTPQEIFGKTLTQLMNGFLSGCSGKVPGDTDIAALAAIADAITKGKYYRE